MERQAAFSYGRRKNTVEYTGNRILKINKQNERNHSPVYVDNVPIKSFLSCM